MSNQSLNKKIFLVSEQPSDLPVLTSAVEKHDFRLITGAQSSKEELVSRIRTSHPDLIFWDIQSFKQDLLSLVRSLQDHAETESIPICFLRSQNDSAHQVSEELKSLAYVSLLEPGFGGKEVHSLLDRLLKPSVAIKFWGVRGSTPCANKENIFYGGNTTCVQVELPFTDELLILDSGTGIRNLGNYLTEFRDNVTGHIFITHPHWDHIQGFPFFKPIYNPDNHFEIHMPPQVTGGCREILSGHLTKTFFPVTLDMFDANLNYITQQSGLTEYNGYSIEYMSANHPINTAIYKLRVGGKTIVFCPDNELKPIEQKTNAYFYTKFKEFLKDADVLIHDAQYDKTTYQKRTEWGHSAWETTVDFALRSGVKNLFLTHHDPDSNDTYLKQLDQQIQEEFSADFESVQLAKEGAKIQLKLEEPIAT
ncbi:MBL fold metallo-hydrolase [Aliifodinibius sp. S!AR15-10]|uniref:MBL fold metallo-hydrolase n=1 Tax=Aliifodinibius sp. S!AR15-10 TaxID=2950437 RepID=UPI0028653013|nr:MBL fold metallo-hydrolase [Aliifodinibius sp. S!AR15-10]MDR8392676.1 MBL fold metallo-hydrolase [Aliifodinibius sp. S!AR15-10]